MSDALYISEQQLIRIKNFADVASGNVVSALSQLIGRQIYMHVSDVKVVSLEEIHELVDPPDSTVVGVYFKVYGLAPANVLFLLSVKTANFFTNRLLGGNKSDEDYMLNDIETSTIMEIGNILTGSYLNVMSNYTKLTMLPSVPILNVDMAAALLSQIVALIGQEVDKTILFETEFNTDEEEIKAHFLFIPDNGSLETILSRIKG